VAWLQQKQKQARLEGPDGKRLSAIIHGQNWQAIAIDFFRESGLDFGRTFSFLKARSIHPYSCREFFWAKNESSKEFPSNF